MEQLPMQEPELILNDLNARLRILEGRYSISRERMFVINQNMIDHYKKQNQEISLLQQEIKEAKQELESTKNTMSKMIEEMSRFASKDNLDVLEKYINFWNPLNFITKEEVIELIKKRGKK